MMVKYSLAPPVAKVLSRNQIRSGIAILARRRQNEERKTVLSSEHVYDEESNSLVQNYPKIYILTLDISFFEGELEFPSWESKQYIHCSHKGAYLHFRVPVFSVLA